MKTMPAEPQYLRAAVSGRPAKVDREAKALRGYVVAMEGPFKSAGRGEFNAQGLAEIARMGNAAPRGLRSHYTHADLSSDGLGKFLGRARGFTMGTTVNADGKTVKAVRADLHFDSTAFHTPNGDLATYVMDLAESDPDAISSSLVIRPREEQQLDGKGRPKVDADGELLPPLWFPEKLMGSDIVSVGDAVDGLLSASIPEALDADDFVRLASLGLDKLFAGQSREVIEARVAGYLDRYLSRRFPAVPTPRLDALATRMARLDVAATKPVAGRPQV